MAGFCPGCGAQIQTNVAFCPGCGRATGQAAPAAPPAAAPQANYNAAPAGASAASTGGLTDNVAGALAYVTIIPAILFLVIEPYNRNKFVRFHSFQCLFVAVAWIVLQIALQIVAHMIPVLGWLFYLMLIPLLGLAGLILWILLLYNAYQGKLFKLPIVGDMAEKQANAI